MTVVPAYGRDYKSIKEVKADWTAGNDFLIRDISSPYDGKYVNNSNGLPKGTVIMVRFCKLSKLCVIKA